MPVLRFETEPNFFVDADAYGDPANPSVLLLHGGGQTRHSWGDTARRLADAGWYAVALDARGHGDSDWSAAHHYDIEHLAADLRVVAGQFDRKPALVGASMGGMTALVAEGERPEGLPSICSAVVLVDIAPRAEQKGIERIFAFMSRNQDGFASLDEAAEAVAAYLPHRSNATPARPRDTSRLEKNLRLRRDATGNPRYYWHWDPAMLARWQRSTAPDRATANAERLYRAARALTVPTLIVRGGISDVVSETVMAEFLDAVPHVKSISVADAGHMVAGNSNHAFTKAVIDFLASES